MVSLGARSFTRRLIRTSANSCQIPQAITGIATKASPVARGSITHSVIVSLPFFKEGPQDEPDLIRLGPALLLGLGLNKLVNPWLELDRDGFPIGLCRWVRHFAIKVATSADVCNTTDKMNDIYPAFTSYALDFVHG